LAINLRLDMPENARPSKTSRNAPAPETADHHDAAAIPAGVTPSMAQFLEIKAANPDSILWYRMGDFYELFFEDAVVASEALGIVLTKRGKHLGNDIPMCGVPIHRADEYLQRLIKRGFRVAVCEQMEDPAEARKRGAKSIVRRDVVRLVTPGTLTEDSLLDAKSRNYLTALFPGPATQPKLTGTKASGKGTPSRATIAMASLDISTGEFEVGEVSAADFPGELVRLQPSEVIASDATLALDDIKPWIGHAGGASTPVPAPSFDSMAGERLLKAQLGVTDLAGFGNFSRFELAAIGALLKYVELTQIGKRPFLRPPKKTGIGATLVIDAASRSSLELLRSSSGDKSGSLFGAIDRTITGAGARELAARLATPLCDLAQIEARLDNVGFLVDADLLRDDLRATLRLTPDIARAVSRLALQRGSPRDLGSVRDGLMAAQAASALLDTSRLGTGSKNNGLRHSSLPAELELVRQRLDTSTLALAGKLKAAIIDDPPPFRRDGGFVRMGYRDDLDEARQLREDSRKVMAALEAKYIEATGVKSLKIKYNNILGYYIEVTANTAKPLTVPPRDAVFRHRQTMSNAMRFTTDELVDIEGRIATAGERALALEQEVFNELAGEIGAEEQRLGNLAAALAELDCAAGLAAVAAEQNYIRPQLENTTAFDVRGGRHPVVEQSLDRAKSGAFIENDCQLGRSEVAEIQRPAGFDDTADRRIWLVTGPNMAGKSTFLRQNALIAVMAQMGSFVPARTARIGLVDRLFSRVGASDDIARGRSTFMVEMVETAGILNLATERSLVILDEVGRGTATFDGLSIAWAVVEYLHDVCKCRALFATHYHELTVLSGRLAEIANATIDVKEWQDEIVFLHKVKAGAADRSYGIQVAKLAGLPGAVITRASAVLRLLEKADQKVGSAASALSDLPLFAATRPKSHVAAEAKPSPLDEALKSIDPDELTPKAALEALYRLKDLSRRP
jgi:DNA mismatch repair protein MutS